MALVISGLMNKQIAFELGISEVTVKAHRGQMMRKMMARSVPDLVNISAKLKVGHQSQSSIDDVVGSLIAQGVQPGIAWRTPLPDPKVSPIPSSNGIAPPLG
jgi:hypothetical protein